MGDPGDYYQIPAQAGNALHLYTTTPLAGPLDLVNALDPQIELYDPAGNLVQSDDNGAGGVNAD